jgi:hypothetical protein
LLGADAIGADRGGVHLDSLHVTNAFS